MPKLDLGFSARFFRRGHYTVLLISLVLFLFVLHPLLINHVLLLTILRVGFMFVLFGACYAVATSRNAFWLALLLALLTAATTWGGGFWDDALLETWSCIFAIAFFFWISVLLLRHVLGGSTVTLDRLFGAICVYMIFGIMWAEIFTLLHNLHPSAFDFNERLHAELGSVQPGAPTSVFLYYSFVTLTTLGYGDISPVSTGARAMASLEAIVGPLYLAILIARLVSQMNPTSDTE
jgi:Ion channel